MEDKKIDKALLWLQIFVVNVLVLLLYAYFSLPVHAEETSDMPLTMVVTTDIDDSYNNRYGTITYTLQNNVDLNAYDVCAWYRDGKATGTDIDTRTIAFIWKRKSDNVISFSSSAVKVISVDFTETAVPKYAVGDTLQEITKDASRYDDGTNKGFYPYYTFVSGNYPIAESHEAAENYLLTGDTSGLVSSGSIDNPDFQDTAYAFTGFTANNKMTATWTGTTERTYLKDEDVEEYVRVSYGFADKDAPDSIKQVDNDTTEYAAADKSLTVDVSDLVPDDDSWFLRYVQVIPCYRQAGLGVWGDFYHGVPCKVYFNEDGSIDKIVRDFPQSSGDYSYKHIFSLDKYSKTIPAPELSSISHNGFTLLNNTNNEYFVDIIVESKFYGVKMEKSAGTWLPTVDTDWIYSSHYYNFADTSQIAINNDVIYFPNLFSANPENDLITDFKNWSFEYPNYSDLPTMSFLKHSTAARTTYNLKFLFDEDSNYTDSEQLRYSSCAESVFYVRYYNKSMVYGPWVRYKYRDGASAKVGDTDYGGAFVDVGQVDTDDDGNVKVDDNGNPVVSDNVSGRQDYGTGETNYGDSSFSFDLSDISKFFDYLKKIFESVLGSLSAFGSVVAACFPFLPEELVNAVIFGICVMMFVGIIKVVKG